MNRIGIDVSKQKLDVAWLRDLDSLKVKTRVFSNDPAGWSALQQWLEKQTQAPLEESHVMLEATGIYHEGICHALHEAGATVYVCNPRHARRFADSLGRRSKNDKRDSIVLARFLASRPHTPWTPEPPSVRRLKALLARLEALDTDIQRENNRLEKSEVQGVSDTVIESIHTVTRHLESERERLLQDINDHIDSDPTLKNDQKYLESIPGIGPVLSRELLATLRSRPFHSARQAAAFLGLVPHQHESGSSVKQPARISQMKGMRVRTKLYMGAVTAIRHNPIVRQHYQKLLTRGKNKLAALCAAMRKLVHIAYGVLKHQTSYCPQGAT